MFMELLWVFMDVLHCSCYVLGKNKKVENFDSKVLVICIKSCFVMDDMFFNHHKVWSPIPIFSQHFTFHVSWNSLFSNHSNHLHLSITFQTTTQLTHITHTLTMTGHPYNGGTLGLLYNYIKFWYFCVFVLWPEILRFYVKAQNH